MALPEGIETCTVTSGVPVTFGGAPVKAFVSVEPSVYLVHTATGTPLVDFLEEQSVTEGVAAQFTLPVDQDGFQDENGNAYRGWYYTARITYSTTSKAKNKTPKVKVFQLVSGQTLVDLDTLPGGVAALPYTGPVAGVTSVNGQTGAVLVDAEPLPARLEEAALVATFAGKDAERPGGLFLGLPPVVDRSTSFGNNTLSNGTDTYHYARTYHPVQITATDIRLVYGNFAYGAAGVSDLTVSAAIEAEVNGYTAASSVTSLTPVMFNGRPSTVIAPGGFAVSDPIPVTVTAGKKFYIRSAVNVAAGGKWPLGLISNPTASEEEGLANGTAAVPGYMALTNPTAVPKPGGRVYSPVAIIGSPATIAGVKTQPKTFLGVGDSIMDGVGGAVDNKGFFRNAVRKAGYGFVDLGTPAQTAQGFLAPYWPRGPLHSSPYTAVICEYGSNDCSIGGIGVGTVQISMIAAWRTLAARGHKVIQTTITPRSTSTDSWKTTGNQTPIPDYAIVRNQLNAWIRAGAPVTAAYAPAAIGSGTYVIGNLAHPLTAYFELADIVEAGRDTNIWKAPQGRSFTATAYQNSFSVDSSTAAYTAADIGESLYVPGAGPAGADVLLEITNVPNATRASVQGITSTAVPSGTAYIGHTTPDGIHPSSTANRMVGDALATFLQAL